MKKKYIAHLIFIIIVMSLVSCVSSPKIISVFDTTYEATYLVFGRVMNMKHGPVENCKVVLIKKDWKSTSSNDFPIAWSDKSGNYSFSFEPLGLSHFWLYFDAEEQGYASRQISITHLMGNTLFETPGNNVVNVSIVMEESRFARN